MPSVILPSFAKGEIGPELYARVDTAAYAVGLRTARNVIIHPHGGVSNRAGLKFLGPVKNHSQGAVLLDFQFKTTDTYIIEAGNLYFRFIREDGHVLEAGKTITGATAANPVVVTATAHGFANGDEVKISGVVGMTEINNLRFTIANKTTDTFELTSQIDGANIDGTAYTAYSSAGTAERVYTVATPYVFADLEELKYTQSADVMTLTHPSYSVRELTRSDHDAWTLTEPTFAPTIANPLSIVAAPGTPGAVVVKYTVTAIAEDTFEESLPGVATAGALTGCTATAANPVVVTKTSHGFLDGDSVELSAFTEMTEVNGRRFKVAGKTTHTFQLRGENGSGYAAETTGGTVTPAFHRITNGNATPDAVITWAAVTDAARYAIYKENQGLLGLIGETETLTFTDSNILADLDLSPPSYRNPFVGTGNSPGTVSYYEQRRVFGGSTNNPDTQYYTQVGNQSNLTTSTPSQDDDAITATLAARQVNDIRHFVPGNDLMVLTSGSEWRVNSGTDSAFAATTLRQKPQTYWGSSHVRPIVSGSTILFVPDNKSSVRSLGFSFEIDGYRGNDLTVLAPHLLKHYQAVRWTLVRSPDPIAHMVRSDGEALVMTFNQEQEVVAWAHWDTLGKFESVASVRPSASEVDDFAYFVVKRTVNGNTVRFIERVASRRFTDVRNCFFVDSGLTLDTPVTITGTTAANPVVVTAAAHGFTNGDEVDIRDIVWTAQFDADDNETQPDQVNNRRYFVADKTTDTFALVKLTGVKHISAATAANPVVITSASHGFANGDKVGLFGLGGMTEVNGRTFSVANATTNTYELSGEDGTGHTTYTDSGKAYPTEAGTAFKAYVEGGEVRVASLTFTGLEHLIGATVQVLADGNVVSDVVVSATGSITLTSKASNVHAGLKYIADIETLNVEAPGGTIQGKKVKIPDVTVRFQDSRGLLVGPTSAMLVEMKQREFEAYGSPTALLTGDKKIVLKPTWESNGRLFMRQKYPLPMTILGVIPTIIIGG